ncbi:gag-pol protein [Lasius niger]|uniref:Gag-pol protein n=1 Tax=Lasius niger TaxID=67767 RepID=A0A0J7KND4_LASNI|nr:gag-pol protein [Lasius niger]
MTRLVGCNRARSTAYHPQTNGMMERLHRTLETAIRCQESEEWTNALKTALLGLRIALKEDLKCSPAELVYGTILRIPGEFIFENLDAANPQIYVERFRRYTQNLRPTPSSHHRKTKLFTH